MKSIIVLILLFGLTQACSTLKLSSDNTQLTVYQKGNKYIIDNDVKTIEIAKKAFSLRFNNKKYDSENKKFYSAQIVALTDESEFDKIKTGLSKTDLLCFKPGSGMATDRSGKYESLIFKNNGHHYAFYKNSDSKRLKLLKTSGDLLQLEFEINSLYYNKKDVKMNETNLKQFYIAFLIDKNLNGIIDKGELKKMTIKIK